MLERQYYKEYMQEQGELEADTALIYGYRLNSN